MSKRLIGIFLITTLTLLAVSIFLVGLLSNDIAELESANNLLQTENDDLRETVASIQQDNTRLQKMVASFEQENEVADESENPPPEEKDYIDTLFDENPIDSYFSRMAEKIEPMTTYDMSQFDYIHCAAWEAEMENCYEILNDIAKNKMVLDCINDERNFYRDYVKANTELMIYAILSSAFHGEEYFLVGTASSIDRPYNLAYSYEQKTREIFNWLEFNNVTPEFIFNEEVYDKQLQETFPEKWQEVFGG